MKKDKNPKQKNTITRKEAIQKAGKLAALTAASMLILSSPKKAAAASPAPPANSPRAPRDWPS